MRALGTARAVSRQLTSSRMVTVGLALMIVLGTAGFLVGRGESALRLSIRPGDAWLPTDRNGSVNLVDGLSGRSSAAVLLRGASGHRLLVTQEGGVVLVLDAATGLLVRINTLQLLLGASLNIPRGSTVVASVAATYVVDYGARTVQRIDPVTLKPLGPLISLRWQPAGTAVVDKAGTLWVPAPVIGSVVPVTGSGTGRPIKVSALGADVVMTSANGVPIAVDRTARRLTVVSASGAGDVLTLPASSGMTGPGALLVPAPGSGPSLPILEPGGSPSLVIVNLSQGTTTSAALGSEVAGHRLGAPVQAGQRIFIPDYSTGSVLVYDTTLGSLGVTIPVLRHPGEFSAEVIDGIAYFNDPSGSRAVVVTPDGQVHDLTKNGPRVRVSQPAPTPASTPTPAPSQPGPLPSPTSTPHHRRHHHSPAPSPSPSPSPSSSAPPPLAPVSPLAAAGPGYVDVSWRPPASGGPVSGYRIAVSPAAGSQTTTGPTSARISGLNCGTTYSFTVSSVGSRGEQVPAQPVTAMSCLPPGPPQGLSTSVSPGQIAASWSAPASDGGGTVTYAVSWGSGSHPGLTGTSDTITGLANFQVYTVTVTAANGAGTGGTASASVNLAAGPWGFNITNNHVYALNVRSGPSTGTSILGSFAPNSYAPVQVICQVSGGSYADPSGSPAGNIWDEIVYGGGSGYVADGYVTTPNSSANTFSPPIWPC